MPKSEKILLKNDDIEKNQQGIEKTEAQKINIFDIPLVLFEEISASLGTGEAETKTSERETSRFRRLNPQHWAVGYNAVIGYFRNNELAELFLWLCNVFSFPPDIYSDEPKLVVSASTQNAGQWCYGRGNLMKEVLDARFSHVFYDILRLDHPGVKLISMILYRAHQLVKNPECIKEKYWQAERFPGDYTRPD